MNIVLDQFRRRLLKENGGAKTAPVTTEIEDLKRKVSALEIACQAMFEIMESRLDVSEKAIIEKMEEIDRRDGNLDGKTAPAVVICAECGRKTNDARSNCVYCGAALPVTA